MHNELLSKNALISYEDLVNELKMSPMLPEDFDYNHEVVVDKLTSLINEVSQEVESYIGRPLGKKTYIENVAMSVNPQINLTNRPIRKVVEISHGTLSDIENIMKYTDDMSLERGQLQVGHALPNTRTRVGLMRLPQFPLLTLSVKYEAGYVLPKDATPEEPSDLPSDIRGIVKRTCVQAFNEALDYNRASGLITRQEGNVMRVWSSNIEKELQQHGRFDKATQRVLDSYKSYVTIGSV